MTTQLEFWDFVGEVEHEHRRLRYLWEGEPHLQALGMPSYWPWDRKAELDATILW